MSRELLYGLLLVSDGGRWGPEGAVLSVHVIFQLHFSQRTALDQNKPTRLCCFNSPFLNAGKSTTEDQMST